MTVGVRLSPGYCGEGMGTRKLHGLAGGQPGRAFNFPFIADDIMLVQAHEETTKEVT